ncbi:MAG TPA: DEAD/DEAH box helicase [Kofleriaceae bacterium]|nr:DEAD/DEAH box helicase [Kofleriaceae bacterium]
MSLDAQLSIPRLRALSGYAFARGDAYVREGRVVQCEREGDVLRGTVVGTRTYEVELALGGTTLESECTCPMGQGFCKHAVALALFWREHRDRPSPETTPNGEVFETAKQAAAWAEAHRVGYLLMTSASRIEPALHGGQARTGLSYAFARWPFSALATRSGAKRLAYMLDANRIAAAARRVLVAEAEAVEAGIAEEARARTPPTAPASAQLWTRLVALRPELRRHAVPRGRAARADGELGFDREGLALVWVDRDRAPGSQRGFTARLGAALDAGAVTCTCGARRGQCVHALALVDSALDFLVLPPRAAEAEVIAAELVRPGWARTLAALAERATVEPKPAIPIELWWQLDDTTLAPIVKKQLKRGGTSAGTRSNAARLLEQHGDALAPQDREVAEQLAGWVEGYGGSYPVRAFAALVGHSRVITRDDEAPIAVARAALGYRGVPAGAAIRLVPIVDGGPIDPRIVAALLDTFAHDEPLLYLDRDRARLVLIDVGTEARHLTDLLRRHGNEFPPESHDELFARLAALEAKLPVEVPDALKGTELVAEPVVVARVRLVADATVELEAFVRPAPGAPLFSPDAGPKDVLVAHGGERHYIRRRIGEELPLVRGMLARLPALAQAQEGPPLCFQLSGDDALGLALELERPPVGMEAEWIEARPVVAPAISVKALRVQLDTKRDWFAIEGDIKIESGRLELAVLLDAARRQQRFVRIGGNRWAELSAELRERLAALAEQTYTGKDRIEVSPGAVPAVRALAEAGAEVDVAPRWQLLADQLAASLKLRPKPPRALAAELRAYQREGFAWLVRLAAWGAGACLADDMGLGKTVQAIALLAQRADLGPALVLAPTSVVFNWEAELARFAPRLRVVRYGAGDRASVLAGLGKGVVVVASYGLLVRDRERFAARHFATAVFDEAQHLKNATTQRTKAARALDADFRIALSGTPLENHLGELWSVLSIVFPGLLGSWDQFRDRYAIPIERGRNDAARAALSRVIRPFVLRRTKAEVARELPARTEITLPVALDDAHAALYEDARLAAVAELTAAGKEVRDEQKRFQVLAALTRLRLLACHPRLYDATSQVPSAKLERLVELVDELKREGHRALVFSQFTSHLTLVRSALEGAGHRLLYLDGKTPAADRGDLVAAFQAGSADAFLISLKAGGTGLNLTAADYVIHLDPWWNPAVEDQATDRAHRIGQTRPVTVYRLIARGTIEERILALHADKRALVTGILEGTGGAARLTTRDLLALLAED